MESCLASFEITVAIKVYRRPLSVAIEQITNRREYVAPVSKFQLQEHK
jgi:hypothetical protein